MLKFSLIGGLLGSYVSGFVSVSHFSPLRQLRGNVPFENEYVTSTMLCASTDDNQTDEKTIDVFKIFLLSSATLTTLSLLLSPAIASDFTPSVSNTDYRFFLAGGASAAFSHGITTPIDVIKTKMQADTSLQGQNLQSATMKVIQDNGIGVLLSGLGPTVVGYGIEGGLKFGVYESLKPIVLSILSSHDETNTGVAYLIAATCAGAIASTILCPMEEIRIKLVTDSSFEEEGLFDGLSLLIKEEGLLSPFAGFPAMLSKQVPYTMGKQVSFDMFTATLYTLLVPYAWLPQAELNFGVEAGAAFLASTVACIFSHPGDVILTETYKNESTNDEDEKQGFMNNVAKIYDRGGISAFFRGISARFVHVGIIITCQLVLYDQLKQLLGLPASGAITHS
jgi:solute carrier family 25 phosphate transporter 3